MARENTPQISENNLVADPNGQFETARDYALENGIPAYLFDAAHEVFSGHNISLTSMTAEDQIATLNRINQAIQDRINEDLSEWEAAEDVLPGKFDSKQGFVISSDSSEVAVFLAVFGPENDQQVTADNTNAETEAEADAPAPRPETREEAVNRVAKTITGPINPDEIELIAEHACIPVEALTCELENRDDVEIKVTEPKQELNAQMQTPSTNTAPEPDAQPTAAPAFGMGGLNA